MDGNGTPCTGMRAHAWIGRKENDRIEELRASVDGKRQRADRKEIGRHGNCIHLDARARVAGTEREWHYVCVIGAQRALATRTRQRSREAHHCTGPATAGREASAMRRAVHGNPMCDPWSLGATARGSSHTVVARGPRQEAGHRLYNQNTRAGLRTTRQTTGLVPCLRCGVEAGGHARPIWLQGDTD